MADAYYVGRRNKQTLTVSYARTLHDRWLFWASLVLRLCTFCVCGLRLYRRVLALNTVLRYMWDSALKICIHLQRK